MSQGFPNGEVAALVGQRLESVIDFPGVPKGTRGTVVKAVQLSRGGALLLVMDWELDEISYRRILRDSFTLSEGELRRFFREA